MKKEIVVKLQVDGLHFWPECPLEGVAFLRDMHRHMFHITAWKVVDHNDRQVEIIELKRYMQEYMRERFKGRFDRMSCEDIAQFCIEKFGLSACEVLEDGENGARLTV